MDVFVSMLSSVTRSPGKAVRKQRRAQARNQRRAQERKRKYAAPSFMEPLEPRVLMSAASLVNSVGFALPTAVTSNSWWYEDSSHGDRLQRLKAGYLDVTAPGYGAQAGAGGDDGAEIQKAIDDAYTHRLSTYIPLGTYEISNSLGLYRWTHVAQDDHANVLVGEVGANNARPMIILKANATGFNSKAAKDIGPWEARQTTRAMLEVQTFSTSDTNRFKPENGLSDAAYAHSRSGSYKTAEDNPGDTMFVDIRNLYFNTNNNSSAVGVYFPGAQNSTITNVQVDAENSFAGFLNLPGAGGGARNIEVNGGQHALYGEPGASGTMIVGAKFHWQRDAPIVYKQAVPLTVVGFDIKRWGGPGIQTGERGPTWAQSPFWAPSVGVMTFVDGKIEVGGGGVTAIDNKQGKTLYLKNVYTKSSGAVLQSGSQAAVQPNSTGWKHIQEYSYTDQDGNYTRANNPLDSTPGDGRGDNLTPGSKPYGENWDQFNTYNFVEGNVTQNPEIGKSNISNGNPSGNLISRHNAKMFQWTGPGGYAATGFNSAVLNNLNVKNVRDYGAVGNGTTDDTAAIQAAINDANINDDRTIVYLPPGKYAISRTLQLHKYTKLVGAGRQVASIVVHDSWRPTSWTATMIETENASNAKTFMGFLTIKTRNTGGGLVNNSEGKKAHRYDRFSAVHWKAGPSSSIMGVAIEQEWSTTDATNARAVLKFSGDGGGKHYFLTPNNWHHSDEHAEYRKIHLERTTQRIDFYSLNVEHGNGTEEILLNTIKGGANFYNIKREGNGRTLTLWNSQDVGVFGSGGMRDEPQKSSFIGIYESAGSRKTANVTLANVIVHSVLGEGGLSNISGATVEEGYGNSWRSISWPGNVSLFRRTGVSSLVADRSEITNSGAATLKGWQLRSAVREAKRRWRKAGVARSDLRGITFGIKNLSGNTLGQSDGRSIAIDNNAAGHGWYVDRNMRTNGEFNRVRKPSGMDLLTVVMHEMGHVLGYTQNDSNTHIALLMGEVLAPSERWAF